MQKYVRNVHADCLIPPLTLSPPTVHYSPLNIFPTLSPLSIISFLELQDIQTKVSVGIYVGKGSCTLHTVSLTFPSSVAVYWSHLISCAEHSFQGTVMEPKHSFRGCQNGFEGLVACCITAFDEASVSID